MTENVMWVIGILGDWNIMLFGATISLHLLPKFVLDKMVLFETMYQSYLFGFGASLGGEEGFVASCSFVCRSI